MQIQTIAEIAVLILGSGLLGYLIGACRSYPGKIDSRDSLTVFYARGKS